MSGFDRRHFLKATGVGAATAAGGALPASATPSDRLSARADAAGSAPFVVERQCSNGHVVSEFEFAFDPVRDAADHFLRNIGQTLPGHFTPTMAQTMRVAGQNGPDQVDPTVDLVFTTGGWGLPQTPLATAEGNSTAALAMFDGMALPAAVPPDITAAWLFAAGAQLHWDSLAASIGWKPLAIAIVPGVWAPASKQENERRDARAGSVPERASGSFRTGPIITAYVRRRSWNGLDGITRSILELAARATLTETRAAQTVFEREIAPTLPAHAAQNSGFGAYRLPDPIDQAERIAGDPIAETLYESLLRLAIGPTATSRSS